MKKGMMAVLVMAACMLSFAGCGAKGRWFYKYSYLQQGCGSSMGYFLSGQTDRIQGFHQFS